MDPGTVLRQAWSLYTAHFGYLIAIAFLIYTAIIAVDVVLALLLGYTGVFLALLFTLAGVFWLQGAIVEAVADVRDGRVDLGIRETLRRVGNRINVLSAAGFVVVIAIYLGFLFFVIPGLLLITWWSVFVPAIMLERKRVFAALGRSRALVRGNFWNVFAVLLITVVLLFAAGFVLGLVLSPLPDWPALILAYALQSTVFAPYVAVALTVMYFHLLELEERRALLPA